MKNLRRYFLFPFVVLAVALGVVAQQKRADDLTPSVERLRTHISYLASEKLEGRRTGTAGATLAAEYIAKEFSRYGLKRSVGRDLPGMSRLEADSPRRYMQEFSYVAGVEAGKNNSMVFTPQAPSTVAPAGSASATSGALATPLDLRLGEDGCRSVFSSNATIRNAQAAFVGYGIKADEFNRDDYAGAQVANRIAIAFAGTPDGENPHGHFARFADVRWKAIAARNSGASALVVIATEDNFKDERLSHLSYDNSAGEAGLPVAVVSRRWRSVCGLE